jgi:hypothetical protein
MKNYVLDFLVPSKVQQKQRKSILIKQIQDNVILHSSLDHKFCCVDTKSASISPLLRDSNKYKMNINFIVLKHIAKFMEIHEGVDPEPITQPLQSDNMKDVCKDIRDAIFVDNLFDSKDAKQLIQYNKKHNKISISNIVLLNDVANYAHHIFQIDSLTHLCAAKIASLIKDKPINEIPGILGYSSDDLLAELH